MKQIPLVFALLATIAALALRHSRWAAPSLMVSRLAFALLILQAFVYFPMKSDFVISAPECAWTFDLPLAIHSLTNYRHIILFALFFLLMRAQLRGVSSAAMWSFAATLAMGLFIELAQGVTGEGHCRMRDLIPDSVGAMIGFLIVRAFSRRSTAPSASQLDT